VNNPGPEVWIEEVWCFPVFRVHAGCRWSADLGRTKARLRGVSVLDTVAT
jgi:hypothetical protein